MKYTFTLLLILSLCIKLSGQTATPQATETPVQVSAQPELAVSSTGSSGLPELRVKIYPNPATDFIRVEWETDKTLEVHVELYDLVGRRISRRKSEESINRIHIDLKSFQRSAYLLKVFTADGKYSRTYRVVKH
jgi:hypothetical protein